MTQLNNQDNIVILYDDVAANGKFDCGKGFSAIITYKNQRIIFDLGGDAAKFNHNCQQLGLKLDSISQLVISHQHWDHCTGLLQILPQLSSACQIVLPPAFKPRFKNSTDPRISYTQVAQVLPIIEGVSTLTVAARWWGIPISEQVLVIEHPRGLIIITGCAHAGIAQIVAAVQKIYPQDIYLLVGGFHLTYSRESKITRLIEALNGKNIQQLAPCHCSSIKGRRLFKQYCTHQVIEIGSGTQIPL